MNAFSDWLEDRVRQMGVDGERPSEDLVTMSRLPSPIVEHFISMWSYGYHFRTEGDGGPNYVSFDSGVAAIITQECQSSKADWNLVEADLLYVGIISDILRVDYGHVKLNVLKCSWIKPHLEGARTIRQDVDGFWTVKYAARQPAGVEPYITPSNARQVYFVDDPINPEWKVVRYKEPRSSRVTGGIAETSLRAPGRDNAIVQDEPEEEREVPIDKVTVAPVLAADVVHVMAHEEDDVEQAYMEMDHRDEMSDTEDGDEDKHVPPAEPVVNPFDEG
ncbi:hypothetical protein M758_UG201200 [Ceratodon purpureus]|nr:hypothetical protein M758_UG201200 [Ceratodon purpureus]